MAPRSTRLAWLVGGGIVLSVGLPLLVVLLRRDVPSRPPTLASRIWHARRGDTSVVVYVTQEERSKSVAGLGPNDDPTYVSYRRFTLAERRIPDGALVASAALGDERRACDAKVPTIIGVVGDIVWMWRDSLEGRSVSDLSVRATVATLSKGASEALAPLPAEARGYAVRSDPAALIARGTDARFYLVDGARSTIEPFDAGTLPAPSSYVGVEDRFNYLVPPGRSIAVTQPNDLMQLSFLTSTGLWYALLSESERSQASKWPSGRNRPSGDVARSLYRVPYRLDDRRQPEIDPARLTPVGTERLIQAGFLIRYAERVWDVPDPSSSLVFAKARLGADEPWELLRLTRDGAVLWRTSTGLTDPGEFLDLGGTHIGIGGEAPSGKADDPVKQPLFVWIDQRTGARRSLSIASGEVR
jgi:hypothetical protein